ncbi:bifunctional glutamate N-acetyltransferase/amino-acid acetyltransferase ArgJ [Halonatronum saccharophilum]|uniref:bifunctional glutamate N-acetyltransferase/amino-acid acetyltransferase ArgJ n=1 Tax=Halonatronum saccharophilum TaxID=150060 RepID=UPI0004852E44|nr:bifunctional glutamate N-acetyltransferase/amino-acid acetyltransferase ArgJ [Halonatronum saccharophilum]
MSYNEIEGSVTAPKCFFAAGVSAGIKRSGNEDIALIYSESEGNVAGVFTTNKSCASSVTIDKEIIEEGKAQAIIINSGNANACTGKRGYKDSKEMINLTAKKLGLDVDKVLVASTGIIGKFLPMNKVKRGISEAFDNLSDEGGPLAAQAIMTTDTYAKEKAFEFEIAGKNVRIGGIAKGSGMIEPNMATMLGFLTTDLAIESGLLKEALTEAVNQSFNRITVDGDQSTNDMVIILGNGEAGNEIIKEKNNDYYKFLEVLKELTRWLAHQIVRDGEGATKFVEVEIKGAKSLEEAHKGARKIANSSLVKTALFGEDPNWGRIVAAIGSAGVDFDLDNLEIEINGVKLLAREQQVTQEIKEDLLASKDINIVVNLNNGDYSDRVWTCDLSYKYVEINGEYHT